MSVETLIPSPLLVWGVFPRLLGVVYFIALASLYRQVLPLAGSRGIAPVAQMLAQMRRDLPLHRRLLHFPSLLWISSSDRALRGLVVLGCVGSVLAVYGGPIAGYVGLLVCWISYLSLDVAIELIYPWDCLLFEAGWLVLLLPAVESLPSLNATALPLPIVVLAFQVLLVRLLWGFGKFKFIGLSHHDFGYLKEFLIFQPMPTRLGWWAYHLPLATLKVGLFLLFLVEVPLPLLAFVPGPARLMLVFTAAALMLGIQVTSNFGFFNVLVLVLLLPLLDLGSSVTQLSIGAATSSWQSLLVHVIVGAWLVGGVLFFPFNSWVAHSWLYWPTQLSIRSRIIRGVLAFYRSLSGLRVLHAYGVFGPQPLPALKFVPVLEGSADGRTWHEYEYRFMPCAERSAPRAFAPYHPRLDHAILYEGLGLNTAGFMSSVHGSFNPYHFSPVSPLRRVMQRLMEPDSPVRTLFRTDPFAGQAAPQYMRATLFALEPTSMAEQRRTGCWWRRHTVGVHLVAARADASVFTRWLNGPEVFHWDDVIWRRRVGWLRRFEAHTRSALDLQTVEIAIAQQLQIPPATVERFWESFIPSVRPICNDDWCELESRTRLVQSRFGDSLMRDFERIAALLAIGLAARCGDEASGDPASSLLLPGYLQVGMLMYRVILAGRERFEQALHEPSALESEARQLTPALGAWLWGVFRFEIVAAHCRAFHVVRTMLPLDWQPGTPSFALMGRFLADQQLEEPPLARLALTRATDTGLWDVRVEPAARPELEEAPGGMKRVGVGEVKALFHEYGADAWLELTLRHGRTFRLQQFVVTCDTRLVEPLMLDRAHTRRRSTAHKVIQRITPGSAGLLFLDGPAWEVQRRAVAPTFTRENVQRRAEHIHAATLRWAQECERGDDLFTAITRLGANLVLETGYGLHPSDPVACEFADELIGYKQRTMNPDPRCRLDVLGLDAGQLLALPWLAATLVNLHRRVVHLRRLVPRMLAGRATCPVGATNWLDGLAAEDLTLHVLTDALNHLYGAYNAVDFVITAALLELSRHPDWRERVRFELAAVLGGRAYPTLDDVPRLPLLWGTIKETLRLYPVAMGIFRQTGAPLEVDGERLPPGTQVVVLPYALHRHPEYWDEPRAFRPDRWAHSQSAPRPFAYIPFLIGPRKCMGQPLAELELLLRVSTVLRTADLDVEVESAPLTPFLVPRFATDLPFRLTRARPSRSNA